MVANIASSSPTTATNFLPFVAERPQRLITWEEFERKFMHRDDSFKYEWVRGTVVKTKRDGSEAPEKNNRFRGRAAKTKCTFVQNQIFIPDNLIDFFDNLVRQGKVDGKLTAEVDTFFLAGVHRRPDLAFFSKKERNRVAQGENIVPCFVVEVISINDQMIKVQDKMRNYREAGVPVIWQIFPPLEEVHVYQGKSMTICKGDDLCSATIAIPDFVLPAKDVFIKPE